MSQVLGLDSNQTLKSTHMPALYWETVILFFTVVGFDVHKDKLENCRHFQNRKINIKKQQM